MGLNRRSLLMNQSIDFLNSLSLTIAYISLLGITALTVADVILRFFSISIGGVPEACTYLLVVLGFLGIAITQAAHGHIEVTFLSDRLPKRVKSFVQQTIRVILIFICLLFVWAGILKAVSAYVSDESNWFGIHIYPVWFFRLVVPLGFGLLIVEFSNDIFRKRNGPVKEEKNNSGEI
jgi:TRAP-type C4-dicarboxylate transport system permease small subunit